MKEVIIVKQGNQFYLEFQIEDENGELLDISSILKVQFVIGNLTKTYDGISNEVLYDNVNKIFKVWLTEEEREKLREHGFKKGNIPWNKGKKGLQAHTEEWKLQAKIRQKELMKKRQTPVICVETGEIFESQTEASRIKKISQGNIGSCLRGKRNIAGGYHWKYVS